jgi:hypothetical protein
MPFVVLALGDAGGIALVQLRDVKPSQAPKAISASRSSLR